MLIELASVSDGSDEEIERVLEKHMANRGGSRSEPAYWRRVAQEYSAVMETARSRAATAGVKRGAFHRLVRENSKIARERWALNHLALKKLSHEKVEEYRRTGDAKSSSSSALLFPAEARFTSQARG
jgi:hypothetical protein